GLEQGRSVGRLASGHAHRQAANRRRAGGRQSVAVHRPWRTGLYAGVRQRGAADRADVGAGSAYRCAAVLAVGLQTHTKARVRYYGLPPTQGDTTVTLTPR